MLTTDKVEKVAAGNMNCHTRLYAEGGGATGESALGVSRVLDRKGGKSPY